MRGLLAAPLGLNPVHSFTRKCAGVIVAFCFAPSKLDDTTASDAIIVVAVQRTVAGKRHSAISMAFSPRHRLAPRGLLDDHSLFSGSHIREEVAARDLANTSERYNAPTNRHVSCERPVVVEAAVCEPVTTPCVT